MSSNFKVGDKVYFLTWRGKEDYSVRGAATVLELQRNRALIQLDADTSRWYVKYCDVFASSCGAEIGGRRVLIKALEDKLVTRTKRLKRLRSQVSRLENSCSEIRERISRIKKSIYE